MTRSRTCARRGEVPVLIASLLLAAFPARAAQPAAPGLNTSALPAAASGPIDFVQDIEPLFTKHCYGCHGPEKQKAGLRLDVPADALRGSEIDIAD